MIDPNQIIILLKEKPGLKAREIANALGAERKDVNSALYGYLRGKVIQDSSYRWWLKDSKAEKKELEKLKLNSNTASNFYGNVLHQSQYQVSYHL